MRILMIFLFVICANYLLGQIITQDTLNYCICCKSVETQGCNDPCFQENGTNAPCFIRSIIPTVDPDNETCNDNSSMDGSVTILNVSGGLPPYSYLWSNGMTTQNIVNLSQGTYIFTITDSNGCEFIGGANVGDNNNCGCSLVVDAGSDFNHCFANGIASMTATASGGTSPYSYQWNTPGSHTTPTAFVDTEGTFCVTVTDNDNCQKNDCVTITDIPCTANIYGKVVRQDLSVGSCDDCEMEYLECPAGTCFDSGTNGIRVELYDANTNQLVKFVETYGISGAADTPFHPSSTCNEHNGHYDFCVCPGDYYILVREQFGFTISSIPANLNCGPSEMLDFDTNPTASFTIGNGQVIADYSFEMIID